MTLKRINCCEQTERRFQGAMQDAMALLGWLVPDTAAAVKAASQTAGNEKQANPLSPGVPILQSGLIPDAEKKSNYSRSNVA